ncbi:MAG: hypothetical protein ABWZ52_14160, partial [Acidimicrobiales bacterium]
MPSAAVMRKLIDLLRPERLTALGEQHPELLERLGTPGELLPIVEEFGELTPVEAEYLQTIPSPLLEGMRAAMADTFLSGRGVFVSYAPGYDFSISIHDSVESVGVHLSGPYPPHLPRDGYEPPPAAESESAS